MSAVLEKKCAVSPETMVISDLSSFFRRCLAQVTPAIPFPKMTIFLFAGLGLFIEGPVILHVGNLGVGIDLDDGVLIQKIN